MSEKTNDRVTYTELKPILFKKGESNDSPLLYHLINHYIN